MRNARSSSKRTAEIIKLRRRLLRAWNLIEREPGKWRAELWEKKPGWQPTMICRTETGPLWLVRETVEDLRDGLPIIARSLTDRGRAA